MPSGPCVRSQVQYPVQNPVQNAVQSPVHSPVQSPESRFCTNPVRRNLFLGKEDECYRCRYRNAIQAISSPSTFSSPGSSPTSGAGQDSEKVSPDASQHSPLLDNSTTARHMLLRKLEGGNDSIERSSR